MTRTITWLWRLFWLIVILQAADLLTTYLALASGHAHEGNAFVRELIATPIAPVLKGSAILFLGGLMVLSTKYGWPKPRLLFTAVGVIVLVYVGIVANNLLVLVAR